MYKFTGIISSKQYGIFSLTNTNEKQSNVDVQIIGDNLKVIVTHDYKNKVITNFKLIYKNSTKCKPIDLCEKYLVNTFELIIEGLIEFEQDNVIGHIADKIILNINYTKIIFCLKDMKFIFGERSTYKYCEFIEE